MLALADDLTGAIEAGAQSPRRAPRRVISPRGSRLDRPRRCWSSIRVAHPAPEDAAAGSTSRHTRPAGWIRWSTRRRFHAARNIGAKLGRLCARAAALLVYAPPIRNGPHGAAAAYVEGMLSNAPFARTRRSRAGEPHRPRCWRAKPRRAYECGTATIDANRSRRAAALPRRMAAGLAALAGCAGRLLYATVPRRHPVAAPSQRVVVNGSLHPVFSRQVAHAVSHSVPGDGWHPANSRPLRGLRGPRA